ncbi:MAG: guanylate kinase [Defluviitaleaceae bacterium]|nr:guanylate kinase [Defluviitaleaceae bacterium]
MLSIIQTGSLFIISGPSGSGKGTVVKALAAASPEFALSVSVTTRKKRESEVHGVHYFFINEDQFITLRDTDRLLEHASFIGNLYGTPRSYVDEQIQEGKTVLLEIEVNGALQVKSRYPDAVLIFLIPPDFDELNRRLADRGTEDSETVRARMVRAREEVALIDKYDYLIINDKIENAVSDIKMIAHAEKLKTTKRVDFEAGFYNNNNQASAL